jgi:hypothetical protein
MTPPLWTELADAAAPVKDGDLVALGGAPPRRRPTGFPGCYAQDEAYILKYIQNAQDPAAFAAYLKEAVHRAEQP